MIDGVGGNLVDPGTCYLGREAAGAQRNEKALERTPGDSAGIVERETSRRLCLVGADSRRVELAVGTQDA